MKIATKNKEIIKKLGDNDITYFFNEKDNIEELIELSKICDVKRIENSNTLYDIAIDCENISAKKYCNSSMNIDEILKVPVKQDYKFSVIIPNYNYSVWLEKCISSVLNQTYKNYEIIFVDDMSTDNSVEIAKKLLRKEDKLIQLKTKRLNGGARNEGIIEANSDYIVFLDSDDWLIDNKVLEEYNNRLCGEDVMFVGVQRVGNGRTEKAWGVEGFNSRYEAMASACSGACFKVVRTDLLKRCLFNEGTLMEDRNHHSRVCYYMQTFTNYKKVSHIWNRDNVNSVLAVRGKNPLWVSSLYRNYADCLNLKLEIEKHGDIKAIEILENRLRLIQQDIDKQEYWQH